MPQVFNYAKLEGRIVEKFKTRSAFCDEMWKKYNMMTPQTLSRKLNNKANFSQEEMFAILDLLEIENECICEYFFDL